MVHHLDWGEWFSSFPLFPPLFRFPSLLPSFEFWPSLPVLSLLLFSASSASLPPSRRSYHDGVDRQMMFGFYVWSELQSRIFILEPQYQRYGYVSDSMWFIVTFQSFYVVDGLYFEEAFFSTMDVAYSPSTFLRWLTWIGPTGAGSCWTWGI
jgi:Ergosterol biosynthesis ERG4/ERG24 family